MFSWHVACFSAAGQDERYFHFLHLLQTERKGERITRTFKTLMTVCLGALLLSSTACEDKETQEALRTCKNDLGNEQKLSTSQRATIESLKAELAQAQAKVQEMTKEGEAGKGGKAMEEKPKAGEAKTAEAKPAKPEKKEKAEKKEKKEAKK